MKLLISILSLSLHLYIMQGFNAKCYQKRCLSDSGNGSRLPESINDWSRGAPVGNRQNYVYHTTVWLIYSCSWLLVCKRWEIKRFDQMRLPPVQNEMLYAASNAMEAPRLCPVTSNLKRPSAGT